MTFEPDEERRMMAETNSEKGVVAPSRKRISLELPVDLLEKLDTLKSEWGVRSRGDALQRVLQQIFEEDENPSDPLSPEPDPTVPLDPSTDPHRPGQFATYQEANALVLLDPLESEDLEFALDFGDPTVSHPPRRSGGPSIDLPGFVRKNTDRLRSSLHPERAPAPVSSPLALFSEAQVAEALTATSRHWLDLYGKPANEAVLEASMQWLARDVWPETDSSEGRPFTWSLVQQVVIGLAPCWQSAPASFERVMVAAGILEDPFSGSTLALRIPTLIRRFVQRVRQRRPTTSFNTLQETMTLHGALKLLNLPTAAGQRLTKDQIRDAFRQQALNHHPDSGGSADMMRRLNEAYQLLKDQYASRG
ncbi:MAG: DnaJ domain-containing protein [Cyanobacteriota bacterium]|nr:DnaJ domain-containing protein [Cyanobacteriota bacterium]